MLLEFTKMHGLGNDFMVVDRISQQFELEPATIARLADRRFGVGFDQLLLVEPPTDSAADFRYRIFNADGSEAQQCGNGARCFARFVVERQLAIKRDVTLESAGGRLHCRLLDRERVEVDMGAPTLEPKAVPFVADHDLAVHTLELPDGEVVELAVAGIGNPHGVILVDDITRASVPRIGPAVQAHPAFPAGVNVGFCEIVAPDFIRLRVYERGAEETRACGTGACAAVVTGIRRGLLGERVKVSLVGGKLRVNWQGPGEPVKMTGPTSEVFRGRVDV